MYKLIKEKRVGKLHTEFEIKHLWQQQNVWINTVNSELSNRWFSDAVSWMGLEAQLHDASSVNFDTK